QDIARKLEEIRERAQFRGWADIGTSAVEDREFLLSYIYRLENQERPAEPPSAWRPIETAPQGDAIVWLPHKGAVMARLCGDLWYDLTTEWLCEPTLWAPMPAGPSETKNSVETAPEGRGVRDNPPPHALGSSEGADTHSRLSEPDAANVAKP